MNVLFESVKILLRSILTETSPLTQWTCSLLQRTQSNLRMQYFILIDILIIDPFPAFGYNRGNNIWQRRNLHAAVFRH